MGSGDDIADDSEGTEKVYRNVDGKGQKGESRPLRKRVRSAHQTMKLATKAVNFAKQTAALSLAEERIYSRTDNKEDEKHGQRLNHPASMISSFAAIQYPSISCGPACSRSCCGWA